MSGLPTINVVEDEQMSSEGSVNAPVAPPRSPSIHSARATSPIQPVDLCGRLPGVVGPLTPVGSTFKAPAMKRVRAVLSRTQTPSTAYGTRRVRIFSTI